MCFAKFIDGLIEKNGKVCVGYDICLPSIKTFKNMINITFWVGLIRLNKFQKMAMNFEEKIILGEN